MAQKRKLDSARMASMYCRQSFAWDSASVIIAFKHFTAFSELSGCFKSCRQKSHDINYKSRQNRKENTDTSNIEVFDCDLSELFFSMEGK